MTDRERLPGDRRYKRRNSGVAPELPTELVEKLKSYDPDADEDMINRAYVFAMKAHVSQKRANGDPYFSHPD